MDLVNTNKQIICILGDYKDRFRTQLQNFESGMQQFIIQLELDYKQRPRTSGGILKISWLIKLKTYPSVVVWIYDMSEPEKYDKILDNYNTLKQTTSLAKKFTPKLVIILTGKNVGGMDFNYLKKDIDLRKVFAVEFENIGQQLKRIKKMITDDSIAYYQDLYNRYKSEEAKLQKTDVSDSKLIFEIKKTLISEIEQNQKKSGKHLQAAAEIVTALVNKNRENWVLSSVNDFYTSYEMILQAEEYREIADQIKFKQFRTMEQSEIITQFDQHFKIFKNLVPNRLFQIQEFLWRVKIFVGLIKFLEARLQSMNYNTVFNYFQATLLSYLKLQQFSETIVTNQIEQHGFQIFKSEPVFIGRPNYLIRQNDQIVEPLTEQKRVFYENILNFRRNEVNLAPGVNFIFEIWKLYSDSGQMYPYADVYFTYLNILITRKFELKNDIAEKLIKFGLIEEYKNLIQLEFQAASLSRQIELQSQLLMVEQERIVDIKKLASQLDKHLNIVISANNIITITKEKSSETQIELKIKLNINQQILDIIETGILFCRNCEIEFIVTNNATIITDKPIERPVQIKLIGKYLDKLSLQIISEDVELQANSYKVEQLSIAKRDPPLITFLNDTAHINEVNEIQVELSYSTEIELLNFNHNSDKLLKIKETDGNKIKANQFTILITDSVIHDCIVGFRIQGEEFYKKIKFIFPFTYSLKIKQLSSVYQNAQNRNKNTVSVFSKCALQLEVKNIKLVETLFIPEVDLDFLITNKQNVIFMTRDQCQYPKFGNYKVKYERNNQIYKTEIEVSNISVVSYLQDVEIISPPTCRGGSAMEIKVKLKTREPLNYFIQLKDQEKKSFFIMGKVKQLKWIEDEGSVSFLLFPIETGRCNLPGVQIEIRQPGNPHQLVFDSSGMKSILILP